MPLGKFVVIGFLFAVAVSNVIAENITAYGYINFLTLSKSDSMHNYQISPMNGVQSYGTKQTTAVPPVALLDGGNFLLLSDGTGNDRYLFLTNNTVEVYRNDLASFQSLYVTSLPLESGCIPWYINGSSIHGNGIFYVQYRGDCSYTQFLYDFELSEFEDPWYIDQGADIIVTTLDDYDVTVSINYNRQKLTLDTTETGSTSIISAVSISTECAEFRDIFPLDPVEERKVFFSVTCSTSEGDLRSYSVDYQYLFSPLNLTVTSLVSGLPVSHSQYIAVRGTNTVTLYDRDNLSNGVPGSHTFPGRIRNIVFHELADLTWLAVQLDSSNVFVIEVSSFIASRGGIGLYELPDTNVDCNPGCLPLAATETELIVTAVSVDLTYSCVVFGFSDGKPEEIRRIPNLPERPFAVVFIPDPSYQPPPLPTIVPPEVSTNLSQIIGPAIAALLLFIVLVVCTSFFVGYAAKIRRGKLRDRQRRSQQSGTPTTITINESIQPLGQSLPVGNSPQIELVPIRDQIGGNRPTKINISCQSLETDIDNPTTPLLTSDAKLGVSNEDRALTQTPKEETVTPQEEDNCPIPVSDTKRSSIPISSTGVKEPSVRITATGPVYSPPN